MLVVLASSMQRAIMHIWQTSFSDELKDLLEFIFNISLLFIMQVQMQVVQVRMRFGEVILAGVRDVKNVSDTQSLDDVSVASVVPITQVQPAREYLVWIALCYLSIFYS